MSRLRLLLLLLIGTLNITAAVHSLLSLYYTHANARRAVTILWYLLERTVRPDAWASPRLDSDVDIVVGMLLPTSTTLLIPAILTGCSAILTTVVTLIEWNIPHEQQTDPNHHQQAV